MRLAIVGAGAVGASVAELAGQYGHAVTALADSRSAAIDSDGVDVADALAAKEGGDPLGDADPVDALTADYDALVEATPTTLDDAEPGFGHVRAALERDRHVVLANKGPVAERYGDVRALERESSGQVRFEATVGGAIPVLSTVGDLGPANVTAARGVLNGTANFVLTRMAAEGLGYEHVLAEAQDLGVAEADPSFDVEGTDAALKCVILANVLAEGRDGDSDGDGKGGSGGDGAGVSDRDGVGDGDGDRGDDGNRGGDGNSDRADDGTRDRREFSLADADVEGIRDIPGSALDLAAEDGRTVRLIGEVDGGVRVGPRLVPEHGTLAVTGTQNIVQLDTRHAGRLNISGRGAGGPETATAVLADVGRLE